jgi:glycosyltransferase involved in cell wall biosynthesis
MSPPPRLALVTPAPPERSGLVDAVHELLGPLAARAELRVYLDDAALRQGLWRGRHHLCLSTDLRRDPGLLPVYQIGNHSSCQFALPLAYRFPGILVLHDLGVHHLVARFFLQRELESEYLDELRFAHGDEGVQAAGVINSGLYSEALYTRFPLFAGLAARSRAVLVHSEWAAAQVRQALPHTPVVCAPLCSGWSHLGEPVPSRSEARERLGLDQDAFVVGTVGNLTASRRLGSCLEAFQLHLQQHPRSVYLFAGREAVDLDTPVRALGIERAVLRLGAVPLGKFHAAIAACDVLCNLRYPSQGETSGSLVRILGVGRPAIVSNYGQFRELPEAACPRVDVDEREVPQLRAYLALLASRPELAERMGAVGREHVGRRHGAEQAVAAYLEAAALAAEHAPPRPAPQWSRLRPAFERAAADAVGGLPGAPGRLRTAELLGELFGPEAAGAQAPFTSPTPSPRA